MCTDSELVKVLRITECSPMNGTPIPFSTRFSKHCVWEHRKNRLKDEDGCGGSLSSGHEFIAAVVIYTTLYKIWSVYVPSWTGRVIFFINVYTRQFPVFQ